ncbi:hypothetical protein EHQ58_01335 [Leptospira ognonensis]|uniref:DUF7840 domain-containing protein n=1 Tax=Leptospira ognonensis TaxID=2484945 RepID=A0A4V3JS39_9LEPT|nr:hypothetical protein [Leptospira ognonensis]TGL63120.1 hypothetical protein EHQ58_01335 [Leptospira ognonensis]
MIFKLSFRFCLTIILFHADFILAQSSANLEPHPPSRINAGIGYSSYGNFLEFQFRPYSHDLLNVATGYVPHSESGKGNATLRYYEGKNRLEITKFSIIRMMSLTPYSSFSESKSYGLDVGLESVTTIKKTNAFDLEGDEKKRITPLNGDFLIGYTFENEMADSKRTLIFSVMAGVKSQFHPYFNDFMRIGPQAVLNVLYELRNLKFQYLSGFQYYAVQGNQNDFVNSLKMRYTLQRNQEIRIEISKMKFDQEILCSYVFMF